MAQTAPTKGALTAAKHSHALAETGYELMDRKRNILVREIMSLMDEAERLQSEIDDAFAEAYASMRLAEISTGGCAEEGAAGVPIDDSVSLRYRSVMGVELPYVYAEESEISGPPYGLAFTSYAIKKAQKRANALKNIVLPGLDADIARITDALEEKEREEFVRLKVIKNRNTG